MPFIEYMLLAILGSAPGAVPGGTAARTITADSVTQPSGGTVGDLNDGIGFIGQQPGDKTGTAKTPGTSKKPLVHARSTQHRGRGRRHGKVIKQDTAKKPVKTGN